MARHGVAMIEMTVDAGRLMYGKRNGLPRVDADMHPCWEETAVMVPSSRFAIRSTGTGAVNCTRSPTANVRVAAR